MRRTRPRVAWLVVAGLSALALAVRLAGIDQGLFGDELFTYDIVTGNGLRGVIGAVHDTSITPPLHYVLAWLSVQLGDPTETIRLPSVIAGTLTVPAVYALGLRTVGNRAALVGAALIALSAFATFYGQEARAYAVLVLLLTGSTLALVTALDTGRGRWWAAYAVLSCLALYTHYTAVFVLGVQIVWALWRAPEARRAVLGANLAVAIGYLPWIPSYLHQHRNSGVEALGFLYPVDLRAVLEDPVTLLTGHPFLPLGTVPGTVGLVLLGAGVALGVVALATTRTAPGPRDLVPGAVPRAGLIVLLALAQPAGEALYSLVQASIYAPRNLIGSLPAICLALGALVTRAARPALAGAAGAAVVAALAIGAVAGAGDGARRPPWRQAAAYVDRVAGPRTPVAVLNYFSGARDPHGRDPLLRSMQIFLERPHRVAVVDLADRARWRRLARSGRFLVVIQQIPSVKGVPPAPALPGARVVGRAAWDGFAPIVAYTYAPR